MERIGVAVTAAALLLAGTARGDGPAPRGAIDADLVPALRGEVLGRDEGGGHRAAARCDAGEVTG